MKEYNIPIPIYQDELVLIQTNNLSKVSKKYDLPYSEAYGAFCFLKESNGYRKYYMAVDFTVTHSLISHECTHIVNMVFKDKCIKLDLDNDEPQAYFMGWVTEMCYKHLKIK